MNTDRLFPIDGWRLAPAYSRMADARADKQAQFIFRLIFFD
jgi:hypothetical protein